MQTTERYIADADAQNILERPTGGRYLYSHPISTYDIFSTYDSISRWYNIDNEKAAGFIKRYDIRQGNTHRGRGLITDPIAHVVTDVWRGIH